MRSRTIPAAILVFSMAVSLVRAGWFGDDTVEETRTTEESRTAEELLKLGAASEAKRDFTGAEKYYKRATRKREGLEMGHLRLAILSTGKLKKHVQGRDEFEKLLFFSKSPAMRARAFLGMALCLRRMQEYRRACVAVRMGVPLVSSRAKAPFYGLLASLYRARGEVTTAIGWQEKVLDLQPKNPDAHTALGILYSKVPDHGKALEAYRKALRLKPGSLSTKICLAGLYVKMGRREVGLKMVKAIEADSGQRSQLAGNLCWFWEVAGDRQRCLTYLKDAIAKDLSDEIRTWAQYEEDFVKLRNDREFRKLGISDEF